MMETVMDRPSSVGRSEDQAAGLRRLFGPKAPRLLPVFSGGAGSDETPWLARLGEAFARAGQRTLLVDASRAQIAARFGLRARYDLLHALDGDCAAADVMLKAAPGLVIVPAARACGRAVDAGNCLPAMLSPLLTLDQELVLLLLPVGNAQLVPGGDVLVPVLPTRESVTAAASQIGEASSRRGTLTFRLLFLGMEKAAADTLGSRMGDSIGIRSGVTLRLGAVAPTPCDLDQVVAASSEFELTRIAVATRQAEAGVSR